MHFVGQMVQKFAEIGAFEGKIRMSANLGGGGVSMYGEK